MKVYSRILRPHQGYSKGYLESLTHPHLKIQQSLWRAAHAPAVKEDMEHGIQRYAAEHQRKRYGYAEHLSGVHEHSVGASGDSPGPAGPRT
jgi:hypothetical protein